MGKIRMKKVGSTRGLEARYGATVRKRYIAVVTSLKKAHKCPKCGSASVQRQSVGVWGCKKCGVVFTGGAYVPETKLGVLAKRAAKGIPTEAVAVEEKGE